MVTLGNRMALTYFWLLTNFQLPRRQHQQTKRTPMPDQRSAWAARPHYGHREDQQMSRQSPPPQTRSADSPSARESVPVQFRFRNARPTALRIWPSATSDRVEGKGIGRAARGHGGERGAGRRTQRAGRCGPGRVPHDPLSPSDAPPTERMPNRRTICPLR